MSNYTDLSNEFTSIRYFKFIQKFMNAMSRSGAGGYCILQSYHQKHNNEYIVKFELLDKQMYYTEKKNEWVIGRNKFTSLKQLVASILLP